MLEDQLDQPAKGGAGVFQDESDQVIPYWKSTADAA